jgi:hypothetical protein
VSDHALYCLEGCGINEPPSTRVFLLKSNIQELIVNLEIWATAQQRRVDTPVD